MPGGAGAPWLEGPLRRFVQDTRVHRVLVLQPDGRVLGQIGFDSIDEVRSACALAAAINASGRELGKQLAGRPFTGLHHGGRNQGIFMGACHTAGKDCLLLAAFDRRSTLGLVRLYFWEFHAAISGIKHAADEMPPADLEADLNSSLDDLFGPLN